MAEYLTNLYKPNPDNPILETLSTRHNFRVIINRLNELVILVEATTIGITAGSNNIALGSGALSFVTTGYSNLALGYQTLYNTTTGYYNFAIGYQALCSNTTGYQNTALGQQALYTNTVGDTNMAIGYRALYANTEGWANVAIGHEALYSSVILDYNIAIGYKALKFHTIGTQNIAIGYYALGKDTEGDANVAIGSYTLMSNTTGQFNMAIGYYVLYHNTTGSDNTAIGYLALEYNTIGIRNVVVGRQALASNTEGNRNAAVGYQAGYLNLTGAYNVFLGHTAGFNETGSYKLYIDCSNSATPLIYGDFDDGVISIYGNLGVGTKVFGTSATRTLALANGTIPSTSPANSVQLYAEDVTASSELKVRDEGGTVTTLSPHSFILFKPKADDPLPWSYHSENSLIGKRVNADISGALRELEQLTGKQFLYYEDIDRVSIDKMLKEKEEQLIDNYIAENITMVDVEKDEAWGEVEVDEYDTKKIIKYDIEYKLDDKTGEVKEHKIPRYKKKKALRNKLKSGYRFDEETGKFLKTIRPTKAEAKKAIKNGLIIPDWIKERV